MPTRPNPFDAAGATAPGADAAFAGLGAGLGFFQDWMKAASSVLPAMGQAASPTSNAWALPTLDPEELDKRIQELKTVQFWLEQNGRMIGMTIQTLEVQRMTLQTLRGMNVPTDMLRESLKVPPQAPKAEPPSAPASPSPDEAGAPEGAAAVNPMAWWNTLTEQFSTLATQATAQAAQAVQAAAKPAAAASRAKPRATRKRSASGSANNTSSANKGNATAAKGPTPSSKSDSTKR